MRLTERQKDRLSLTIAHEVGHFLFGHHERQKKLSRDNLQKYNEKTRPRISIGFTYQKEGLKDINGRCKQITVGNRDMYVLGGPAMDWKLGRLSDEEELNWRIKLSGWCETSDFHKLLMKRTSMKEVLRDIRESSQKFTHKDMILVRKVQDHVLSIIQKNIHCYGHYEFEFEMKEFV